MLPKTALRFTVIMAMQKIKRLHMSDTTFISYFKTFKSLSIHDDDNFENLVHTFR